METNHSIWTDVTSSSSSQHQRSRRGARRGPNAAAAERMERAARLAAGCKPVVEGLEGRRLLTGSVTTLTLINADTDQAIGTLASGATLNLATLPTRNLNVRAEVSGTVESVRFGLDAKANYRTENSAPYSLAGDKGSNYYAWTPAVGSHTLVATPYDADRAAGTAGSAAQVQFRVIDQPAQAVPAAPSGLTASVTDDDIALSWTDNSTDETEFRIERSSDGTNFTQLASVGANVTTYTNENLAAGTYTYRVRAVNGGGASAASNTAAATVAAPAPQPTAPAAPSGLSATAASSTQIDLAWTDNASDEHGFYVERSTGGGAFARVATIGANVRSYSSTGLTAGTAYSFRVLAFNAAGTSAASNTATATTASGGPTETQSPYRVTSFTLVNADTDQDIATLTDGYVINFAEIGTRNLNVRANLTTGSQSVRFGLDGNPNYRVESSAPRALASDTGGDYNAWTPALGDHLLTGTAYSGTGATGTEGDTLAVSFTVVDEGSTPAPTPPAAPSGLTAAASGDDVTLRWSDNSTDETGFRVERATDGTSFVKLADLAAGVTTYTDANLTPSTYTYRIRAFNADGTSAASNAAAATVAQPAPQPEPSPYYVTSFILVNADTDKDIATLTDGFVINFGEIGTRNLNVRANLSTGSQSVMFGLDGVDNYRVETSAPRALASDTGGDYNAWTPSLGSHVLSGTAYSGTGATGTKGDTLTVNFTVVDQPTAPNAPVNLAATAVSDSRIDVRWSDNSANESGFRIERSTDGTNFTQIATVAANATSYANTGLSPETRYYYRVRAYNSVGNSAYTTAASATTLKAGSTALPGQFPSWDAARAYFADHTGPTNESILQARGGFSTSFDGQVIENVFITGTITIQHRNVILRNFKIDANGNPYGIRVISGAGASGAIIEDGEIYGSLSSGIFAQAGLTMRRVEIHHSDGDATKFEGFEGTLVEDCWWHHLGLAEGAHADGVQIRKGSNFTFRRNFSDMPIGLSGTRSNSAFIIGSDLSAIDNVVIEGNWLNGGNYTIYLQDSGQGGITNAVVRNNWFGDDYRYGILRLYNTDPIDLSGNRWHETGELIDMNSL